MIVTWGIHDGYARSRPQKTHVPDDELAEMETEEDRYELIRDFVQSDYDALGFYIMRREED